MRHIYLPLFLIACLHAHTQEIDQQRMQRDIEVAEKILGTLIGHGHHSPMSKKVHYAIVHRPESIKGSYMQDYGVTFNVATDFGLPISTQKHFIRSHHMDADDDHEDIEVDVDEEEDLDEVTDAIREFLVDYGNLIHQLKSSDKIIVKTSGSRTPMLKIFREHGVIDVKGMALTVEAIVGDLLNYESGELDREELYERIVVREHDSSTEPQLDVFAAMLERLYQSDLSDSYYLATTPFYDRVKGFGVTYHLKYYSSKIYENNRYSLPTIGKKDLSEAERNEIVESMYPTFLSGLQTNLLDYAHILRNLETSEVLVLQIELTQCNGCNMPEEIEVSIKKSAIDAYRSGSVTREEALATFNVKELQ